MNQGYQYALPYPQNPNMGGVNPNVVPDNTPYPLPMPPMPNPNQPSTNPNLPNIPSEPVDPFEQSYIENIIRLNKGKVGTFHMTYSDSLEWRDKVYKGVVLAAGKDHIVISDQRDGKRYILLLVYLDWVEFNEPIDYEYPIR